MQPCGKARWIWRPEPAAHVEDPNGDGYFVHQANGPGLSIFGASPTEPIYDSSADINGVFARWTAVPDFSPFPGRGSPGGCFLGPGQFPVPEPTTLTLVGLGLAALGLVTRGRQRET